MDNFIRDEDNDEEIEETAAAVEVVAEEENVEQ